MYNNSHWKEQLYTDILEILKRCCKDYTLELLKFHTTTSLIHQNTSSNNILTEFMSKWDKYKNIIIPNLIKLLKIYHVSFYPKITLRTQTT